MYGAQFLESGKRLTRTMMCLRRKESDASTRKPGWQALSDFVVPIIVGAASLARRLLHVASASQFQWPALCTNTCALTSGSSGSTNSPLRYAFVAH